MKYLMILGGSKTQIPFINIAREKGYRVIVTDKDANADALKLADIAINIDALNKKKILELAKKYDICGILTKTECLLSTVAYVSQEMNLIGLSEISAEASSNKFLLKQILKNNHINTAKYLVIDCLNEIRLKDLSYPIVMKPIDSGGSRGVVKINSKEELFDKFKETKTFSLSGKILLEEYIQGPEYSVETVTQNNKTYIIAITEKTTSGNPYFVETRHIIPADLSKELEDKIHNIVTKTLKAIGLNNSVCHTELKLRNGEPFIIELGARFGGDYICTDLVELSTGINMYRNLINIIIGDPVIYCPKHNLYSGIQFLDSHNFENAFKSEKVMLEDSNYIRNEYYQIENKHRLCNSADRLGYYIMQSNDRSSLEKSLDFVLGCR